VGEGERGGRPEGGGGDLSQLRNRNRGASSAEGISPPSSSLSSGSRPGLRVKAELDLCAALERRVDAMGLGLASELCSLSLVLGCAWGVRVRVRGRGRWIGKADTNGNGGVRLSGGEGGQVRGCRGGRGGGGGWKQSRGLFWGLGIDTAESRCEY
jgi:hypothetical protein